MKIIVTLILLIIGVIWDIRKKEIPKKYLVFCISCSFLVVLVDILVEKNVGIFFHAIVGILPGGFFLLLSYISREQIGYGDGGVILWMGIMLGIEVMIGILMTAMFVFTFVAIGLLIFRRIGRKSRLPFLPFLLVGMIWIEGCKYLI